MLEQSELDWLVAERPAPLPLDPATTMRVRDELVTCIAASRPGSRWLRLGMRRPAPLRIARVGVSALALSGVATVLLLSTGGTSSQSGGGLGGLAVQPAAAAPLAHLSAKLLDAPAPTGDATLVIRKQTYPSSPEIDGADLYADNGNYYYAPETSQLPALIKAGDTVNTDESDSEVRDIDAAKAAFDGPIDAARQRMSVANLDPVAISKTLTPAQATAAMKALVAQLPKPQQQTRTQENASDYPAATALEQENGMIWDNSTDALLAGAGDPQVRAGVLHLLATIPQITVTHGTQNGQPTLVLTDSNFEPAGYQEQLIINATTGIPVEFYGGTTGQAPSVSVAYTITRVTVAGVENGDS